MAKPTMSLHEHLNNLGLDGDFLRRSIELLTRLLMEVEVSEQIGAGRYERTAERNTHRNGYRHRRWETRVGVIDLAIPKPRHGSYFPSFLEPRRLAEKALLAVVQSAYIQGVSTRRVDDLLEKLGLDGIDKSKVSRICKALDEQVQAFLSRPLEAEYPYVWLDAVYLKVRENHRIVNKALVIAIGVRRTGERDVLGFELGASEEKAFWLALLRGLKARGLDGVQLVVSDEHLGLVGAVEEVFAGASWQRCRVHFMRNVLAHVPKANKQMVAAALRTIFSHTDPAAANEQRREVARALASRWPKAATVVKQAGQSILSYMAYPQAHWARLYSTNPLERVNKEVRRRTNVVGIFPDDASVARLVGSVLIELDDDWQSGRRYFSAESMAAIYQPDAVVIEAPAPFTMTPIK